MAKSIKKDNVENVEGWMNAKWRTVWQLCECPARQRIQLGGLTQMSWEQACRIAGKNSRWLLGPLRFGTRRLSRVS